MQQPRQRQALCLLLTLFVLFSALPAAFAASVTPPDPDAAARLQSVAPPGAQISIKRAAGVVSSLTNGAWLSYNGNSAAIKMVNSEVADLLNNRGSNRWDGWYVDDVRLYFCAPGESPGAVTGLGISALNAMTVRLQWPAVSDAMQYETWTAKDQPYFDLTGKTCATPDPYACYVSSALTYEHADLGDAAVNHTYIVRTTNSCGQVSGNSPRMAEFDFALVPGEIAGLKYGWKGIADTVEVTNANPTNGYWGLNPSWYYNWGNWGPWNDPAYVPMISCTDDVNSNNPSPTAAADLARQHPGRVWLIFNEPDLINDGDNCGTFINQAYPAADYFNADFSNYDDLGRYIAQQYIRYYDAMKAADPTARFFAFGSFRLPGGVGDAGTVARATWDGFIEYLANPVNETNTAPRPLDGIAVHAYPLWSANCPAGDMTCFEQVLKDTHDYFQAASAGVTARRPIWITEIGNLAPGGSTPGAADRAARQAETATTLAEPLLNWFIANAVPGGTTPYYNGLAWFSTHDCRYNPDNSIKDFTASDLLDIGPVTCPLAQQPTTPQLSAIGSVWSTADCPACACPGPDCP